MYNGRVVRFVLVTLRTPPIRKAQCAFVVHPENVKLRYAEGAINKFVHKSSIARQTKHWHLFDVGAFNKDNRKSCAPTQNSCSSEPPRTKPRETKTNR